ALDRRHPDAGLYPRDAEARAAVEAAERFGHDELQTRARRIFRWAGLKDNAVRAWMAREGVGLPAPALAGAEFLPVMRVFTRTISKADDATVRDDLARLPGLLDETARLIDAETIGAATPNAADLQIFTSIRLLLAHADLRPVLEPHP